MSVHIAVPHLHMSHLSRREILRAAAVCVPAVLLLAADAAGFTVPALTLLVGAVVAWRITDWHWRARHLKAMEGLQEVAHQQRLQIAGFQREQAYWWNTEVSGRNSRWPVNESARVGVR
ncbi:hypothetical protein K1W54_05030 [Micromonospora sp. CPCC 205371]|nr:hypothetical protein [Micromonospora sp. CPCC 205371]